MSSPTKDIAIIGCGVAGMTLALTLHARGIPCKIYEVRSTIYRTTGALILSPNALRILDKLGVYEDLEPKGFSFQKMIFKNNAHETTDEYYLGSKELFGYDCLRLYRRGLLDHLRFEINDAGIPVFYGAKFSHVVSETEDGVEFAFEDSTTKHCSLLIGTDGIHSTVRRCINPSARPVYAGMISINCAFPRSALRMPPEHPDYPLPVAVQSKPGTFIMAPQDGEGSTIFAGTVALYPEQDHAGWDELARDKAKLLSMFCKDKDAWPDIVQSAMEAVPEETVAIWPFYNVPRLSKWSSEQGRVVILGDAAHAVPPTAGQGASQALEDAYSFTIVLAEVAKGREWNKSLDAWEKMRNARVDGVKKLTQLLNKTTLPKEEREKLEMETWGSGVDQTWLYCRDLENDTEQCLKDAFGN
ncbi:kynurenine 3-monooxygenase [Rhizodiscina lignyota]|uniref:Kynurenine 3-monooxygenase n=1 Tax=Rhizodiscina lignyota TaxID=1504668 RepID=A0A9P4IIE5_9PEZI|nr:kynurenine 3-monooxygenase [Rhizodiscina lignyota]